MSQQEAYPYYGTQEEKDLWQQRFVDNYNTFQRMGVGSGGGVGDGNVEVDETTGRVTGPGSIFLGYAYRYLHIRFSSDADGTNQIINLNTYTGSTLFVGVYNAMAEGTPPGDANFVYTGFAWNSNFEFSYSLTGARNIRYNAGLTTPNGFQQVTTAVVVDLEDTLVGAMGASAVNVDVSVRRYTGSDTLAELIASYDANTLDPFDTGVFQYDPSGMDFDEDDSIKILVAETRVGGVLNAALNRTYTYLWERAGVTSFTPDIDGQTLARPFLFINLSDLGGMDTRQVQFLCNVSDS